MFDFNRSGQQLYFSLISAISGNPVISGGAAMSGRVSIDNGAQAPIAGPVVEDGGGQYHYGLFDSDVAGRCLGFFVTASGCVPVEKMGITTLNVSGKLQPISGGMPTISGQVFPASGSAYLASGAGLPILLYPFAGLPALSGDRNLRTNTAKMRNRLDVGVTLSGYLTVYAEDDITIIFQQPLVSVSGGQPIARLG